MRRLKLALLPAAALALAMSGCSRPSAGETPRLGGSGAPEVVLAAQGRLEGRGRTARVGAEIEGVVSEVLVTEGDEVESGQVLARLNCPASKARTDGARARLAAAKARLALLLRGAREEERREAVAARTAVEERLARARQHADRQRELWGKGRDVISRDAVDAAEAEERVALAESQSARWRSAAVLAPPRPEEESLARAEVAAAKADLEATLARESRCEVRSPLAGTVVLREVEPGAAVSPLARGALFEVADLSSWHARVEVDEAELDRVRLGQPVVVTADAFGGRSVAGTVARIGRRMGPKGALSTDPAERRDREVLEVLVLLEEPVPVDAVGLRVIAKFLESTSER